MSEHLAPDDIAGIAMLAADDPQRVAAEAHARGCAQCRAALDDARAVLSSIDALAPPPLPSQVALARARRAVQAEMARERSARPPWLAALAVPAGALLAFIALALGLPSIREVSWVVGLGVIAIVTGRTAAALVRATPRDAGFALALGVGASVTLAFVDAGAPGEAHSVRCVAIELAAAALPLALTVMLARGGRIAASALGFAATAASGALAGQLALRSACPGRELEHLLSAHLGGVIAAALIGAALARIPAWRAPAR